MDKMQQWREGLLSNAEITGYLLNDMANLYELMHEVQSTMFKAETDSAEKHLATA